MIEGINVQYYSETPLLILGFWGGWGKEEKKEMEEKYTPKKVK